MEKGEGGKGRMDGWCLNGGVRWWFTPLFLYIGCSGCEVRERLDILSIQIVRVRCRLSCRDIKICLRFLTTFYLAHTTQHSHTCNMIRIRSPIFFQQFINLALTLYPPEVLRAFCKPRRDILNLFCGTSGKA